MSNKIIEAKTRVERALQRKVNIYEGKLEGVGKEELVKYQKVLSESLKKINQSISS
jgi:hypothetical protein